MRDVITDIDIESRQVIEIINMNSMVNLLRNELVQKLV